MRIPVIFDPAGAETGDAWLVEGDRDTPAGAYLVRFNIAKPVGGHAAGCGCCTPRGPVVAALSRMFRARATGAAPFFGRVIILAAAEHATGIRAALQEDLFTAARYRMD